LGLISGALILGIFTLPFSVVVDRIIFTITDLSVIFLALAMGIIPMLGGTMKESSQIESLVNNIRFSKRYLLPFSAALMGLLPMPGGALLSAPIVEKGGEGVPENLKAAINNLYRHLFILIYPLAPALIVSAKITNLDVYHAVLYLLPGFFLALILGYIFFLRKVKGTISHSDGFSWKGLLIPLAIILSAPVTDFVLKRVLTMGSLATLIGVSIGFILSIILSRKKLNLKDISLKMRPWNFSLIIIGMFLYLHIFQESDVRNMIASIPLPPLTLAITAGFLLAFLTGRVQLPASIIFPVYMATAVISPLVFSLIYMSMYFGYIISPVHPCLVITCEYFHISIKDMIKQLFLPTAIIIIAVYILSIFAV